MLASRGLLLGRALKQFVATKSNHVNQLQSFRNSHIVSYRIGPPPASNKTQQTAEFVSAFMWWWVLWHLWHEYEHITGEFHYPNPKKWTDKELGIPAAE